MSEVITFDFDGVAVRMVDIDATMHFAGNDVTTRLGYANSADAMRRHCKGVAKRYPLLTAGGVQEVRVLTEADVMRLIVNSKLPAAVRFERLVFEEILPTIRRTGGYGRPGLAPKEAASAMAQVKLCKSVFGPAHARALWREVGLPYAEPSAEDIAATKPPERPAREMVPAVSPAVPVHVAATADAVILLLDRPEIAGKWSGTASDLLRDLLATSVDYLPQSNQALGLAIVKARDVLHDRGVTVERIHSGVRRIIIRRQSPRAGRA